MSESTKAEEWRIERAKRMNSNASAPPSIRSGGEELDIFEIMQRFQSDGSCEHIIKQALTRLADRAASTPKSITPLLQKIIEICDAGSAQEFDDADERLRAIRGLIIGEAV